MSSSPAAGPAATSAPPGSLWYEDPELVNRWVAATFEGGGAKGVAYVGALSALLERKLWFKAVAGASAGALTAFFIAAGATIEQVRAETTSGLAAVETNKLSGLLRLWGTSGYFRKRKLLAWLDGWLRSHLTALGVDRDYEQPVTFSELYAVTGIELNVVAANISLQRQMVFNHHETPDCQVVDAVAASCSIPFALESSQLWARMSGESNAYIHTIVDGGVWSNFPLWVFADPAYRLHRGLPAQPEVDLTLGFLLHEQTQNAEVAELAFERRRLPGLAVYEREGQAASGQSTEVGLGAKAGALLLWPLAIVAQVGALPTRLQIEHGRWPRPSNPLAHRFIQIVEGGLAVLSFPLLGPIIFLLAAIGVLLTVAYGIDGFADSFSSPAETAGSVVLGNIIRALGLAFYSVMLAGVLAFEIALVTLLVMNVVLARSFRRMVYGLARTYVAAPAAPPWATQWPSVVALPIPPTVGTLSFELPATQISQLENAAHAATAARLEELLPQDPSL